MSSKLLLPPIGINLSLQLDALPFSFTTSKAQHIAYHWNTDKYYKNNKYMGATE